MIVRVQVRLDRIEIDLSAVRLVERLLQTCIPDSHPGEGDVMPRRAEDESPRARRAAPGRAAIAPTARRRRSGSG
jgi:hypothetical protein